MSDGFNRSIYNWLTISELTVSLSLMVYCSISVPLWRKWIGFLLLDSIYFGCGRFQHDFKGHSPLHGHNERTDHFWKPDPLRFISVADTCLVKMGHLSPSWPTALAVTPQGDLHSLSQVTHWEDIPKRLGVFGPFLCLTLRFLLLKHL